MIRIESTMPPAARGPSARGAYMLRKSFVLVFIRFRVRARHHYQEFITALANHRTDPLTHCPTDPLIQSPPQKLLIKEL
jgi:hypothetical protein